MADQDPALPLPAPGEELRGNTAEDIQDTNTALDDLLKQSGGAGDEPTAEEIESEEKKAAEKAAAEAKEKAEKEAAEKETPAAEENPPVAEEKETPASDDFEKVELPPYTKPKSVEAFATVKTLAKQRIAAVEAEKTKLAAELAEAREAAAKAVKDPELEKELKDLRDFRLKFDVEADPSFKEWDTKVKANDELIYARLKTAGIDENSIKKIQELGGPSEVNWDSIKDKIPESLMRYIETKLFENEDLGTKKKAAIEVAKQNASEFVKTRQEDIYKQTEGRAKATKEQFDAMLPKFDWLKDKTVPANAKPEEKAAIEAGNAFNKRVLTDVQEALNDDSPGMRAILIAGFAQLMKVRADFESTKASHSAEIAKLSATLKEKEEFIKGIKQSSTARLSGRGTVPGETKPVKSDVNEDPGSAIDRLLKAELAKGE